MKTISVDGAYIKIISDVSTELDLNFPLNGTRIEIDERSQKITFSSGGVNEIVNYSDANQTIFTTFASWVTGVRSIVEVPGGSAAAGIVVYGRMRGPISDSFTRPADTAPYSIGDAIQNATSSPATRRFANLFPATGGSGYISIAAVVRNPAMTARLRIHLFATDPTTKAVDNAAFSVHSSDEAAYLGYIDLDAMSRGVACSSNRKEVVVAGAHLFYQIETLDGFTPASGTNYLLKATLDSNV